MSALDTATRPKLAVIIASSDGPDLLDRCLGALVPQVRPGETEVIVAGTFSPSQTETYPRVAFLPFPPDATSPALWGAGLAQSTAAHIAITETRSVVSETWVQDVLASRRPDHPISGGAVEPLPGRSLVSWAAYFCDYGQFMRPLAEGPADELPGNNLVFARSLLDRASVYTRPQFWKTYWGRALQDEGVDLVANPSFLVHDAKTYRLGPFLLRRFRHGRCFGGMRNEQLGISRRMLYAAASPVLPVLLSVRTFRRLLPKRRHMGQLFASAPLIVSAVVAWSVGEAAGYLTGPGDSCRHV